MTQPNAKQLFAQSNSDFRKLQTQFDVIERMDATDNYKETDDDLNSTFHTVDEKQFKREFMNDDTLNKNQEKKQGYHQNNRI